MKGNKELHMYLQNCLCKIRYRPAPVKDNKKPASFSKERKPNLASVVKKREQLLSCHSILEKGKILQPNSDLKSSIARGNQAI